MKNNREICNRNKSKVILDLNQNVFRLAGRLRESFLLDYGTLLMGHRSLWQVGLTYLDHCPTDGLNTIELLLPRLPLKSEARIQKILREAAKRDLLTVGMFYIVECCCI